MPKRKARLTNMKYNEVSFVDKGANQEAHVVLFKRDSGEDLSPDEIALLDEMSSADAEASAEAFIEKMAEIAITERNTVSLAPEVRSEIYDFSYSIGRIIEGILNSGDVDKMVTIAESIRQYHDAVRTAATNWIAGRCATESVEKAEGNEGVEEARIQRLRDASSTISSIVGSNYQKGQTMPEVSDDVLKALAPEVQEYVSELKKAAEDAEAAKVEAEKKVEEAEKKPVEKKDEPEDILKGLSPEVRTLVEKAQKDAQEATEQIQKMQEDIEKRDMEEVVKGFAHVTVDVDNLLSVKKADPAAYEALLTTLRAADAQAKASNVFSIVGKSGGKAAEGGATDEIGKKAEEIMKSDSSLTMEQARVKVLEQNPSLYDNAVAEGK